MNRERNNYERKREPEDVIFGVRAIIEAIKAEREINRILIQKGMNKELFMELKEVLQGKDYNLQFVPVEKLNRVTTANHQGVLAYVSPIEYKVIEELVDQLIEEEFPSSLDPDED